MRSGARFIITSSDYIYEAARQGLKSGPFPVVDDSEVVIEVEKFTKTEREQILYNHLKLGDQPKKVLEVLDTKSLEMVAADAGFLPELARRLGQPVFTKGVDLENRRQLLRFVREPVEYLRSVLVNLYSPSRAGTRTRPLER